MFECLYRSVVFSLKGVVFCYYCCIVTKHRQLGVWLIWGIVTVDITILETVGIRTKALRDSSFSAVKLGDIGPYSNLDYEGKDVSYEWFYPIKIESFRIVYL